MQQAEEFIAHSDKQEDAILSTAPITLLGSGTQYGKTVVGALRMRIRMHEYPGSGNNFIVTAPTYKIMAQATLPAFMAFMHEYGTYNKKDDVFTMHSGAQCFFRTETDPDSVVGITNVRHIWCDEAGKYRLYFWENIQARADFCGCAIDLTTSPYALNWIYKDLIRPYHKGERTDLKLVQAASWENPYHSLHDPEKRRLKQANMDPRRFKMIYGGEWSRMEGLVYDCWDDGENFIKPFELPAGTRFVAGVDWGYYPDPAVIKVRAITPAGMHYGVSEWAKTKKTINDIVTIAKQKQEIWGIERFWCDPSQPGYIDEFNRAKLNAHKAKNDIRLGLDAHYDLIKQRRYKEFIGACPVSVDERETYHYPEEKDLRPDQDSKEQLPVDKDNHAMDTDRYISIMESNRTGKITPRTPTGRKKFKSRLDYLKKAHKIHNRTEKVS